MIKQDDRTPEQRRTHNWAVVARDNFMSGWGEARSGYSRCCWAVADNANIERLYDRIKRRSEMRYVSIVNLKDYRPPRGTAHFHVYVVADDDCEIYPNPEGSEAYG